METSCSVAPFVIQTVSLEKRACLELASRMSPEAAEADQTCGLSSLPTLLGGVE